MTSGQSAEVRDLLAKAPDNPKFTDARSFQFKMFNSNAHKSREEVFISPLALAANAGDFSMMESVLSYLKNVDVERGLVAKAINPPILNNRR